MIKNKASKNLFIFIFVLISLVFIIFRPLFFQGKTPLSSNLLVSFFNPWAQEKFSGWENGIPNKPVGIDDLRIFYPQRDFTTEMLGKAEIPFWNPYNFSGNTHLALSETAVFYPLSLIFFFLSQLTAWSILVIIQPIIACIGTYLYLNLIIKDKKAALFGALVFGFSGVVIVRMVEGLSVGHALIWLPFVFFGIEGFIQKNKIRYLIIALLSLLFSLLSGWFQFTFYIYIFSFLYAFLRIFNKNVSKIKKNKLLVFSPFVILPLITLYQTIPAIQMLYDSPRGINTYNSLRLHLMPLQHLLTFIFPDLWGNPGSYNFFGRSEYKESILYIGLVPFFLSLISIVKFKSRKIIKFFSLSALLALMLGTNNPISDLLIKLPIPIVSSFLPDRVFLIASFSLSILSAFGLNYLLSEYKSIRIRNYLFPLIIIGIVIIIVDVFILLLLITSQMMGPNEYQPLFIKNFTHSLWQIGLLRGREEVFIQFRNIILQNIIFVFLLFLSFFIKKRINSLVFFLAIMSLTIFGQVYFSQKYIAFSQAQFVFPRNEVFSYLQKNSGINRFISTGEGYIPSNFSLFFRLYSPDGLSAMYLSRYGELVRYAQTQGISISNVPRVETRIEPSSKSLFTLNDSYLLRFMQIDGVKYVVKLRNEKDKATGIITNGNDSFKLVWQNDKWQIFEYRDVLPRIFWTSKYKVVKNDKLLLSKLFDEKFDAKTILLEKEINFKTDPNSKGEIKLLKYEPNIIELQTYSNGNGFVYISDNYFVQFKATVDGKEENILRANYSFRAIPVGKGDHKIILFYDSNQLRYTFIIGAVVIIIVTLGGFLLIKQKKIYI